MLGLRQARIQKCKYRPENCCFLLNPGYQRAVDAWGVKPGDSGLSHWQDRIVLRTEQVEESKRFPAIWCLTSCSRCRMKLISIQEPGPRAVGWKEHRWPRKCCLQDARPDWSTACSADVGNWMNLSWYLPVWSAQAECFPRVAVEKDLDRPCLSHAVAHQMFLEKLL